MDNYLLNIIKNTTQYIEANILEELTLDDIADNVHISKFHLLRIWKGATTTGLMEYVRRRRIALSLTDLITENNSIEFISSKYGFGCERSYNRVFKEEFNTTAAKWRKNPTPVKILDEFNADFINCAGDGLVFMRSITIMPALSIAGPEYIVSHYANNKCQMANTYGVNFFYNKRPSIINPVEKNIYIGYTTVLPNSKEYTLYQPSIQVDQNSILPPNITQKTISAHKYGVFTYMGPHCPEEISSKTLAEIWKFIFETWMPTVEFNLKEKFSFEYINYEKCNKQYCECDLFFPISIL
jgi:AraC family transcriptional regulator